MLADELNNFMINLLSSARSNRTYVRPLSNIMNIFSVIIVTLFSLRKNNCITNFQNYVHTTSLNTVRIPDRSWNTYLNWTLLTKLDTVQLFRFILYEVCKLFPNFSNSKFMYSKVAFLFNKVYRPLHSLGFFKC